MPDPQPRQQTPDAKPRRPIRWWPVPMILLLAAGALIWVWTSYGQHRQDQNVATANVIIIAFVLLLLWCLFFSRLRWKVRLGAFALALGLIGLVPLLFRLHGVTGDLVPILEWRWKNKPLASLASVTNSSSGSAPTTHAIPLTNDYPQFLGPHRNGTVEAPRLARDWKLHPPQRLWLQPVGLAWSGFAV